MKQAIALTIGLTDFKFNVTATDHNDLIDAQARGESITAASHNFVMRTIDEKDKDNLKGLLTSSPGAEVQIAAAVKTKFSPVLEIKIKK